MKHVANVVTNYYGKRIIGRVDEIEVKSTFRNHRRKVFIDFDWWYNFAGTQRPGKHSEIIKPMSETAGYTIELV